MCIKNGLLYMYKTIKRMYVNNMSKKNLNFKVNVKLIDNILIV